MSLGPTRRHVAALLLALALPFGWACDKKSPTTARSTTKVDASVSTSGAPVVASATPTNADTDAGPSPTNVARMPDCSDAPPRAGKSIGHTSTVFKLELTDGTKVAWKPNAKKVRGRYKGEIAAFRLATALGLDNVLAACPRVFDSEAIIAVLTPNADAAKVLTSEAIAEDGKIYGAGIVWYDGLSFWPLEKEPLRSEARSWLTAGSAIPPEKKDLARQTSTLVAFDFLTGNWDRYSGANVGIDRTGTRILYVDNDAGFMEVPPKDAPVRNEAALRKVDRFSRSLIEHLRKLDTEELGRVFGEEAPGRPLLSPNMIAILGSRRKDLLATVDEKIKAHGESETLFFP